MPTLQEAIARSGMALPNRHTRRAISAQARIVQAKGLEAVQEVLDREPEVPGELRVVTADSVERRAWRVAKKRNL